MKKGKNKIMIKTGTVNRLFDRVVSILEQAKANTIRAINHSMVLAYWLIGREIVQELQKGEARAEYGKQLIESLSKKLSQKFGRGYSTTNLRYFRTFYTVYEDRQPEIRQIGSGESEKGANRQITSGVLNKLSRVIGAANQLCS